MIRAKIQRIVEVKMSMLALSDEPAPEQEAPVPSGPRSGEVTLILIALNILIFLVMVVKGVSFFSPSAAEVLPWGADFGPLTTSGQWWRLVTSCFLHFGIVHIGMNMFILMQIGLFTEMLFGKWRYLTLYLLAGIGGNIAGLYVHPFTVAAGASGAIFGLYGGMLAFLLIRRGVVPNAEAWKIARGAGIFLAYNVLYGLASPNTDLVAHGGGLVTGFVLGCALAWSRGAVGGPSMRGRFGLVAVASVVAVAWSLRGLPKADSAQKQWYGQLMSAQYVPLAKNGRVIYSGSITRVQAEGAAKALISAGFGGGAGATLMLDRSDGGTYLWMQLMGNEKAPTKAEPMPWDDPKFLAAVKVLGPRVAEAVGGPPLTVRMLNHDGQLRKEVVIDSSEVMIGTRDAVEFLGQATEQDARALGAALIAAGYFRGNGALVRLAKSSAGTSVGFDMREGSWDRPGIVQYLMRIGPKIAPAVGGLPLKIDIVDDTFAVRKEMLVQ